MVWYVLKMLVLLPLLGGMIWGSLKLTRHMQDKLAGTPKGDRRARLVETCFLGPGMRLAVVEFRGREILVGCSRQGLVRLAETAAQDAEVMP